MCSIATDSDRQPAFHYDAVNKIRHYACSADCPNVQRVIDEVCAELCGSFALRFIANGANTLIEVWRSRPTVPGRLHLEVAATVPMECAVEKFFRPTKTNVEQLFRLVPDLSLLEVVLIDSTFCDVLVSQFDLAASFCEDDEDEDDDDLELGH